MEIETFAGIDLGGTRLKGGLVNGNELNAIQSRQISTIQSFEDFINIFFSFTDSLLTSQVKAIGVGVPGLVNDGIVYDVVNIPCWQEVDLKALIEKRYQIPAWINNDANCFALGEFIYGKGKDRENMIGLTIGTGLGTGIIANRELVNGENCGAGEIGMVPYLDHCIEYYASGQFFLNEYQTSGEDVYLKAQKGDAEALRMYEEMGTHLGNAIKLILFAYDPGLIVLGGSVTKAFRFFQKPMWRSIQSFPYNKIVEKLQIETSALENSGILGAAALCNSLHK